MNLFQAAGILQEVGYEGMLLPDHVPHDPTGAAGFAFLLRYIKGILQALDATAH